MLRTEGTYYARAEHGGHRVVADNQGFLVAWPLAGEVRYPSARQTLIAIANRTPSPQPHHRDPKVSFNRYFRRGRYSKPKPQFDAFTLFSPDLTMAAPTIVIKSSPDLSIEAPKGIDLAARGHEVRKLFYAGYGRRVASYGYDPDDVLQEIYKGLLIRNHGKCPFDPTKSSFGHYVHMVCGCIVSNYRRRYSRLERNEQFGVAALTDDSTELLDVRDADIAIIDPVQLDLVEADSARAALTTLVKAKASSSGTADPTLAGECLNLMLTGYRKGEIAELTDEPPNLIAKVLRLIRTAAAEWRSYTEL